MNSLLKGLIAQEVGGVVPGGLDDFVTKPLFQTLGLGHEAPPVDPAHGNLQKYAKQLARQRFGKGHWNELNQLVGHESSWNPRADNPTSSAYGLFQFLDSTRDNYNLGLNASPYKQIRKGLDYIADRYGNPTKAWDFWEENNWY